MYRVLIKFQASETLWQLLFRENPQATIDGFLNTTLPAQRITDDSGNTLIVKLADLAGVLVTDLRESLAVEGEVTLMQHRAQAKLQARVAADPEVRSATSLAQRRAVGSG